MEIIVFMLHAAKMCAVFVNVLPSYADDTLEKRPLDWHGQGEVPLSPAGLKHERSVSIRYTQFALSSK